MSFPLPPSKKHRDIDFEVGELLGRGNFTSVYRSVEKATGEVFALKIVDRYRAGRLKKLDDLKMEKLCLLRTNHVNIAKMYSHFTDTLHVYVVLEPCFAGELWHLVQIIGCPYELARYYLAQVLNAMDYLRRAGIVHRDLKAENVVLTMDSVVKLIDFGTAKDLENPHVKGSGNCHRNSCWENYVGTPQFMPKEVIDNISTDFRSDMWSLGCLIFQVLTGVPPFHAPSEYFVFKRVMEQDLQFPPGVNEKGKALVKEMLVEDPDARLGVGSVEEIMRHSFFEGIEFCGIHLRSPPVLSLADLCLRQIGKQLEDFGPGFGGWDGYAKLCPEVRGALDRMSVAKRWMDEASHPKEASD